ncbi:CU044_5270 family protein [Kribbella sp. CA-293567]|uniref:CU044_5270 family protein n=1 Tax=Kribbella sp. CA-293567 TaxID=3002436 RepID=UPI0022DDA576|nr:CU044_5270 family protein [Kribbella sp. CA-293567]WBQ06123.1 CU044_5270 family protein [Kribbella sp. CA-293567]
MTDLKDLLDQAAGHEPAVTSADVAADLGRARLAARRRRITGIGLTAGAAAVTIAALAVPLVLSGGSGSSVAAPPGAVTSEAPVAALSAGEVLLVAAAQEEKAEAASGKYFRVRTVATVEWTVKADGSVVCCGSQPAGPGGYKLREERVMEKWTGLKGGTAWLGTRSLGTRPATAADVAAWKQAGAPASWNAGPSDSADKRPIILSTKPGKGSLVELKGDADRYPALGRSATLQEVLALPTTPAALRQTLLKVRLYAAPDASEVSALTQLSSELLSATPALPKVRAAAFRLLAGLKGATVEQNVTDAVGRKGTAVSFSFRAYRLELQLIVDPKTGKLLSSRNTGGKDGGHSVLLSSWTNDTVQVPPAKLK